MTRKEQRSQMKLFFEKAESKEDLKKLSMLFILDMTYERKDITRVLHDVEVEKGWH
jgi:hypothetical protein